MHDFQQAIYIIAFSPLVAAILAGLFGNKLGRRGAHSVTILGVAISFLTSVVMARWFFGGGHSPINFNAYVWAASHDIKFHVGFLIDRLTTPMLITVNFVSLLVHIYTIGYMKDDPGYQRFFSYISLFTFAMIMLVASNNFLQLFFGWEGVGVVSYLLIGFWYNKESAIQGSLKAFLVNRVGDFGFLLGIAAIYTYFGTLDYATVFKHTHQVAGQMIHVMPGVQWSVMTVTCLLLFVGAMGKSAQVPLHVWLPESMEGPTPISALIHAATMVTAGIFMVTRMSPLFELSNTALSVVMVIGATGALFLGILGVVQNDIKRVVAYSTLSQLGYMIAALGASAYSAGMFHLITHACFKALLFLGAGSVIIGMHHEQDMRKMGGLWRYMPITYVTYVIGSLALCGIPPFAGFYSKDAIIEAIYHCHQAGAGYAYFCVAVGAFVTALYTFRSLFMTFHGKPRMDAQTLSHVHESPFVVCFPLVILAIPSIMLGAYLIGPMLFYSDSLFGQTILVLPKHEVLHEMAAHFTGAFDMALHGPQTLPFWMAILGAFTATIAYIVLPHLPNIIAKGCGPFYKILVNKYGFDSFNDFVFVRGGRQLGQALWQTSDVKLIDNGIVNNSGRVVQFCSRTLRHIQTGFLPHYAFIMLVGLIGFLVWQLLR